jgi:hypothetical protein
MPPRPHLVPPHATTTTMLRPPSRLTLTHFVRPPTRDDDASPSRVVMTRDSPLVPPHSTATAPRPRVILTHLVPPHRTWHLALTLPSPTSFVSPHVMTTTLACANGERRLRLPRAHPDPGCSPTNVNTNTFLRSCSHLYASHYSRNQYIPVAAGMGTGMGGDTRGIPMVQPSDGAPASFPSSSLPRDSDILC